MTKSSPMCRCSTWSATPESVLKRELPAGHLDQQRAASRQDQLQLGEGRRGPVSVRAARFSESRRRWALILEGAALHSVFSLAGLIILVFFLARLTGDPTNLFLPIDASVETRQEFAERHGFDDPLVRAVRPLRPRADPRVDFGESIRQRRPAIEVALEAFPTTLTLAFVAMGIVVSLAIVIGALAAYRPRGIFDRLSSLISLAGASAPEFWVAIMAILLFAVALGWLPTSGTGTILALGPADRRTCDPATSASWCRWCAVR